MGEKQILGDLCSGVFSTELGLCPETHTYRGRQNHMPLRGEGSCGGGGAPEFTQTHVHRVGNAIQPSHPLSSPFPPSSGLGPDVTSPEKPSWVACGAPGLEARCLTGSGGARRFRPLWPL